MTKKTDQPAGTPQKKNGEPQPADNLNVLSMEEIARRITQAYDPGEWGEPDASEYLEMSRDARSKKAALDYAQKALELEPDNLDAAQQVAELTAKDEVELLEKLAPLLEKGKAQMVREGYWAHKGEFWLIFETRPYMRLRYTYMRVLIECGMLRRAAAEGEALLELCRNDNLGVRYDLIHLYAALEDEQRALALVKNVAFGEQDCQMLLAMSALYFRLGDLERSLACLQRLAKANRYTKRFIAAVAKGDEETLRDAMEPTGYSPGTLEELVYGLLDHAFLFETLTPFFTWARRRLKSSRAKG